MRALTLYQRKTEEFRKKDETNEVKLFLTINNPNKLDSIQAISTSLVKVIKKTHREAKTSRRTVNGTLLGLMDRHGPF